MINNLLNYIGYNNKYEINQEKNEGSNFAKLTKAFHSCFSSSNNESPAPFIEKVDERNNQKDSNSEIKDKISHKQVENLLKLKENPETLAEYINLLEEFRNELMNNANDLLSKIHSKNHQLDKKNILDEINYLRSSLLKLKVCYDERNFKENQLRIQINQIIGQLEREAVEKCFSPKFTAVENMHQEISREIVKQQKISDSQEPKQQENIDLNPSLTSKNRVIENAKKDGKITSSNFLNKDMAISFKDQSINISCTQIPSLSQFLPSNMLCGYYALFFLLQSYSIDGSSLSLEDSNTSEFLNRELFNECFDEWTNLIFNMRATREVSTKSIIKPSTYKEIGSLAPGEFKFLIEKSKFFEKARSEDKFFILELEEDIIIEGERISGSVLNSLTGNNKWNTEGPAYCVLKFDAHYYFCKIEKNKSESQTPSFNIQMIHSLPDNLIYNEDNEKTFIDKNAESLIHTMLNFSDLQT